MTRTKQNPPLSLWAGTPSQEDDAADDATLQVFVFVLLLLEERFLDSFLFRKSHLI
jgi:hypothetical protein